ncbi:MAG: lipid-A-disaccharide synthase [Crocinitomicaceae bacterium]|nr:lipid-A-disaccharide synthase [Crocinitomicaceae bacterium]|tara:strand:- start:8308 stop:9438 length:1131 start_codon:yes stop_codon:yes gene_type:complete
MKYYIIAGEASGDLHASNLMKQIKLQDEGADFRVWGGDLMKAEGAQLVKHYKDLAFMGFVEVLLNLRTILSNLKICKQDIQEYQPDVLVLVDYPGFNLRIAEWAHEEGLNVHYYISPQIWAWKENRVHKFKKFVDEMYVILPFEKGFYAKHNVDVNFVGHPLLDAIEDYNAEKPAFETFCATHQLSNKPIVALLPGSRKQEISTMLPIMLSTTSAYPEYQFVIAGAPSQDPSFYDPFLTKSNVKIIFGQTYELLQQSTAALVTSGTATLETALFNVPEVVCYKGNWVSYWIARSLVKVNYISLVNLIMDQEVVKELIQGELNPQNLKKELDAILPNGEKREKLLANLRLLREKLGGSGASKNVATLMLKTLRSTKK